MAGNKVNTKKRDEKNKSGRNSSQGNDETEDIDYALLRKPILTSITGFAQARKIFDVATEELKGIISNECDLLYECKVCRNIFRSLLNFISHKRIYCKENFNSSQHGHFLKAASAVSEVLKIKELEEGYQESLKGAGKSVQCENDRIPLSKDLSAVIENITKNKGIQNNQLENQQIILESIPKSSVAVFQNVSFSDCKKDNDNMRAQVQEINSLLSRDNAVLQSDGKFTIQSSDSVAADNDNVIQISDDEDNESSKVLKCKICDQQFATLKTMKVHMKYKHLESRLVFPCPDCLEIFSTSWSVYRHLFKVHRKTAAQIRRLRESIQAKAFHMNNPPAFYEKRKMIMKNVSAQKKTEEERLDQENQAWMDNMEGDGELPRCGGCGRTFERRAALAAHTHTCQPRSRALATARHRDRGHDRDRDARIQIQIRKDYQKGKPADDTENKNKTEEVLPTPAAILLNNNQVSEEQKLTEAEMSIIEESKQVEEVETVDNAMKNKANENKFVNRLPFAYQAEKSNLQALKQRMSQDVELEKLQCKICDIECNFSKQELLDHMATHYKWLRYGCKLCNFKNYYFENLPEHIKTVHKLKGDTDFYFSTIKAIDGAEALELSERTEENKERNEPSPESRRPSRCSSDSSRMSDDSSSSSTLTEVGSRKRKANIVKNNAKRKRELIIPLYDESNEQKEEQQKNIIENDSSSNSKIFEENSSDMDDSDERPAKRQITEISSVALRRPVRKKTKPKNEDFEYDLSNLLKMEAQGYRDSQNITKISTQNKKKTQPDIHSSYDIINKECCGALATMSRKTMENFRGLFKNNDKFQSGLFSSRDSRLSNIFARPQLPKPIKIDKISPKKDEVIETNSSSPGKEPKSTELNPQAPALEPVSKNLKDDVIGKSVNEDNVTNENIDNIINNERNKESTVTTEKNVKDVIVSNKDVVIPPKNVVVPQKDIIIQQKDVVVPQKDIVIPQKDILVHQKDVIIPQKDNLPQKEVPEKDKSSTSDISNKPPVLSVNFRQGLEVIQNPLIKKNLTDFSKAGMKTKILVIKPINRGKDGKRPLNAPLKFQTIKLKDPIKTVSTIEEKKSDQVMVVPVPKVDCTVPRTLPSVSNISSNINAAASISTKSLEDNIETDIESCDATKVISNDTNNTAEQTKEQSNEISTLEKEKTS